MCLEGGRFKEIYHPDTAKKYAVAVKKEIDVSADGVKHLSIGVESLQDRHLRTLKRPYTTEDVEKAVKRAVSKNFQCVNADFERTSVWAFTKTGIPKYCSVTVPLYVGLGASGGSYLKEMFSLNTFHVKEYINALEHGWMAVVLSIDLRFPTEALIGCMFLRMSSR